MLRYNSFITASFLSPYLILSFRLSSIFLPILNSFTISPVFTIREIATSSIIAFTPEESYGDLTKEMLTTLLVETNNNKIHSSSMILLKVIRKSTKSRWTICTTILEQYKNNGGCLCCKINCDLLSVSLTTDVLIECFYTLKSDAVEILLGHLKNCFHLTEGLVSVSVGKPVFLKSLVKAVVIVLCEDSLTAEGKLISHDARARAQPRACAYPCVRTRTRTYTRACTRTHRHTFTRTLTQARLHRHAYTGTPTQARLHRHLHRHAYTGTLTYAHGIFKSFIKKFTNLINLLYNQFFLSCFVMLPK